MSRTPRRYAIHLMLDGGHQQVIHFRTLEAFQQWYGTLNAATGDAFVNVPLTDLDEEYLVVRPRGIIAIRVEPEYAAMDG